MNKWTNNEQMMSVYNCVKYNTNSLNIVIVNPTNAHIVDRANERGIDTSILAKVISKGILDNNEVLEKKVKSCKHSLSFLYNDIIIVLRVMRGDKDNKLLYYFRTCWVRDKTIRKTIHEFNVTI